MCKQYYETQFYKKKIAKYGTCGSREQCTRPIEKNASAGKCAKRASQMKAKLFQ